MAVYVLSYISGGIMTVYPKCYKTFALAMQAAEKLLERELISVQISTVIVSDKE